MNKFLTTIFSIILLLIFICTTFISRDYQQYSRLYKNKTAISISFDNTADTISEISKMKKLTEEKGIVFSNIVSSDNDNYYIRTTNENEYKKNQHNQKIDLLDNNTTIKIVSFLDNLSEESILNNIFWFEDLGGNLDSEKLIKILSKDLSIENIELIDSNQKSNTTNDYYSILFFLCSSVFLVILLFLTSNLKTIGVLKIEGYGFIDIYSKFIYRYKDLLICSFSISSLATLIFLITQFKSSFRSILFFFLTLYLVIMISLTIFFILSLFAAKKINSLSKIKNKQHYRFFVVLFSTLTLFSMIFYCISTYQLKNAYDHSLNNLNKKEEWNKTENYYKIFLTYTGEKKVERERATSKQLEIFYKNAVKKDSGLFIMDSSNYYPLGNSFIYKQNEGNEFTSPGGKKIVITPNYLIINPTFSKIETEKIMNQIVWDTFTRNILVPERLKSSEDSIRQSYLDDFIFKKITVHNIYSEELGENARTLDQDLKINIIYVSDNIDYFSYDLNTAFTQIIDPIVELETFNIDISYLNMYASAFSYVYYVGDDPYEIIRKNIDNNYKNIQVRSVYTELSDDIKSTRILIEKIILQTIVIIVSLLVIIYSWISSFYLFQKKKIHLRSIQGENYWRINASILFTILIITCISLLIGRVLRSVNIYNFLFLILYLLNISLGCSVYFYNKLKRTK